MNQVNFSQALEALKKGEIIKKIYDNEYFFIDNNKIINYKEDNYKEYIFNNNDLINENYILLNIPIEKVDIYKNYKIKEAIQYSMQNINFNICIDEKMIEIRKNFLNNLKISEIEFSKIKNSILEAENNILKLKYLTSKKTQDNNILDENSEQILDLFNENLKLQKEDIVFKTNNDDGTTSFRIESSENIIKDFFNGLSFEEIKQMIFSGFDPKKNEDIIKWRTNLIDENDRIESLKKRIPEELLLKELGHAKYSDIIPVFEENEYRKDYDQNNIDKYIESYTNKDENLDYCIIDVLTKNNLNYEIESNEGFNKYITHKYKNHQFIIYRKENEKEICIEVIYKNVPINLNKTINLQSIIDFHLNDSKNKIDDYLNDIDNL